jgi:hypothetical protein
VQRLFCFPPYRRGAVDNRGKVAYNRPVLQYVGNK